MFKVECPGCKSSYNVDERRVPEKTGMKMRCPRCQASFVVRRPGEGTAPAESTPEAEAPPSRKSPEQEPTVVRERVVIAPRTTSATAPRDPDGVPGRTRTAALDLDDLPGSGASAPDPKAGAPFRKQTTLGLGTGKDIEVRPSPAPVRTAVKNSDRNRTRPNPVQNTDRARTMPRSEIMGLDDPTTGADEDWDLPAIIETSARAPAKAASASPLSHPTPVAQRTAADRSTPGGPEPQSVDDDFPVVKTTNAAARLVAAQPRPVVAPGPSTNVTDSTPASDLPAVRAAASRPGPAVLNAPSGGPQRAPDTVFGARTTPEFPAQRQPPPASRTAAESDLPALPARKPAASGGGLDFELDLGLPVVRADLPAVVASKAAAAPRANAARDLPSVAKAATPPTKPLIAPGKQSAASAAVPPLAASTPGPHAAGLPTARQPSPPALGGDPFDDDPFAGVGLPVISGGAGNPLLPANARPRAAPGGFDLDIDPLGDLPAPMPAGTDLLPASFEMEDFLPTPGPAGGLLPAPAAGGLLPAVATGGLLPTVSTGGLLPAVASGGLLPAAVSAARGDPELEFAPLGSARGAGAGVPHRGGLDDDPLGFGIDPPARPEGAGAFAGSTSGGDGSLDLELAGEPSRRSSPGPGHGSGTAASDEGLEFGIPAADARTAEPPRPAASHAIKLVPARAGRGLRIAAVGTLLAVVIGGGLTFTRHGAFGYYAIYDAVQAKTFAELTEATTRETRAEFAKDSAATTSDALARIDATHAREPRARAVAAYGAYAGYLRTLRFGVDVRVTAHAASLLSEVPADASGWPYDLARAAQSAASPQGLSRSRGEVSALLRRDPKNPEVLALVGEVSLLAKDLDTAKSAWTTLTEIEGSPRAEFGTARALEAAGDRAGAVLAANRALVLAPSHAGARLLLATHAWETARDEATALKLAGEIVQSAPVKGSAGTADLIAAHALLGQVHLARSRVSQAEAAFNEAVKIEPKAPQGLLGLGETLYRAGRFSDALARFNAAVEADPDSIPAKIGASKTKIALERLQEARDALRALNKKLKETGKADFRALTWQGRAEEAIGDRAAAEASYLEALRVGGADADVIDAYVSLSQMLLGLGRTSEAQSKLEEARSKLPKSVTMFRALGEMALGSGRHEDAARELGEAVLLDPTDVGARFKLGVAHRRMARAGEATAAFDKVAAVDPDYPGLLLERALLLEQSGQAAKALELFEAALAKAPSDPDMMLRVAAALLAGEQPQKAARAEELARKVILSRANSAEANHYLGRALLFRGTSLVESLKYLKRAADLDGNRAEYHLYVAWAANVADDQVAAQASLERALELDKSLADAYWQRGILRRRQRAVVDAEKDLLKALELRPSRYEAYATLAEVYEDQQKWPAANAAWSKAIAADGSRAQWRFRYGKLLSGGPDRAAALVHLTEAVRLGSLLQPSPAWTGEACLLLADAERQAGKKLEAIEHYQRFLSLAAIDSPYRKDALAALRSLGVTAP